MGFIEQLRQAGKRGLLWGEGRARRMKVVENLLLADRRALLLVECEGQRFLLGSTPGAITLIAHIDEIDKFAEFRSGGGAQ